MNETELLLAVAVAAVLSLAAIFYTIAPLLKPGRAMLVVEDDRLTQLLERKDATLRAIKDLEFDYRVGKMDEADFQRLDQRLRHQAIGLIQQIEKIAPVTNDVDVALEAAIARRRKLAAQASAAPERTKGGLSTVASTVARYCVNCGHALEPGHKFCAECGAPVAAPAAVEVQSATS